jgi:aminoglycoside phosphotransferase (APT) family kinase protein
MAKMHEDEVETSVALVEQLIAAQFPAWAELSVTPIKSAGTDNALYRLGEKLVVRLPRVEWAVAQVSREQHWLPQLAPHLSLPIPTPIAKGKPDFGYPWNWSVYEWLEGEMANRWHFDHVSLARDLAFFLQELQQIDTAGAPPIGVENFGRGVPLSERDEQVRSCIAQCKPFYNTDVLTAAWETALHAPVWEHAPVWIHGDLHAGNMLTQDGKLSAIIDFGCFGIGDPACDLQPAWNLLSAEARDVFRTTLGVDDPTWMRGRGWALSWGIIALPYYHQTNPTLADMARHTIEAVLGDITWVYMAIPEDVKRYVQTHFSEEDCEEALAILQASRTHGNEFPEPRLLRCMVVASQGRLPTLQQAAQLATIDFRDLIVWGEYEWRGENSVQVRDLAKPIA